MLSKSLLAGIIGAALLGAPANALAAPRVVATIAPVHSITSIVMQGIAEPTLLMRPGASPHEYALRPSEAEAIDQADVVVWVGEQLEGFMARPIAALAAEAVLVTLAEVPGLQVHEVRADENWSAGPGHDHGHDRHGASSQHSIGSHDSPGHHDHRAGIDPHLWLDPVNGKVWANAIADALATADPANAAAYRENAAIAQRRTEAIEAEIRKIVAPVRERPYVVFHDAYRYFEERFGTNAIGSVSLGDAQKPGAAHVQRLRDEMRNEGVICIFTEPQFEPRLVSILTEDTAIEVGVLDPLGASLAPGADLYPSLLLDLARSPRDCLASGRRSPSAAVCAHPSDRNDITPMY